MPNDPSIKCQGLYESLKKQGYSKSEAARISNGLWRKGECTGKRKEKNMSEFLVTKDAKGNYRWVLISSSAYVDRDGEIVTEKALVRAVERMDESGDYGQLRWWHTGVVLGVADYAAVHAHQLIESGTFVSKSVAAAVAVAAQGLGASIGFKHPPTQPRNKQYEDIAIQERSILPRGKESNLFTQLSVTGGRMDDTKKAALFDLLGEEEATALLSRADMTAKAADEAGFTRKEKGLGARLWDWLVGQPEFETIKEAAPVEEGGELELTDDEPAAVTDETKAAKEDDMDEAPVTRAEFMKLAARIDELLGERKKETDTLATKEEVAQVAAVVSPVVTIQQETVKRLGEVEKQVQALTSENLPRGLAGVFRASQAQSTVSEKAATLGEKMKQSNDPLDSWVDGKFGA